MRVSSGERVEEIREHIIATNRVYYKWKASKEYMVAGSRAKFEEIRKQLERKYKVQKTMERNMWRDINGLMGGFSQYLIDLENL